jgi:hypothetical protein
MAFGAACDGACNTHWKACAGEPGSGLPPQSCSDEMYACKDACLKQLKACEQ